MNRFKVNLNATEHIRIFVQAAINTDCNIDVVSGRFIVDASSIMGIFALDLSKNVEVVMHTTDETIIKEFKDKIGECIIED